MSRPAIASLCFGASMILAWLIAGAAFAEVPELAQVPAQLPDAVRLSFTGRRQALEKTLAELVKRNEAFEVKYGAVKPGSPEEQEAEREQADLRAAVAAYVDAANRFNDDLARAAQARQHTAASAGAADQVRGTVEWVIDKGAVPVRPNDPIRVGGRYRTGFDGRLRIRLADGAVFVIGGNSDFVVDEFVYDPDPSAVKMAMRVLKGVFRYVSAMAKPPAPNARRILTPAMAVGIRGTDLILVNRDDGSVEARLFAGTVECSFKVHASVTLEAGKRLVASADGKTVEVKAVGADDPDDQWKAVLEANPAPVPPAPAGGGEPASSKDLIVVAAATGGAVTEVLVSRGDIVMRNDPVARVDAEALKADVAAKEADVRRCKDLFTKGALPEAELRKAEAALEVAARALAGATLVAPCDGIVASVDSDVGTFVVPLQAVVSLRRLEKAGLAVALARRSFQRGLVAAGQQAWLVAIDCFAEAQKAAPADPMIFYALANAHTEAGHDLAAAAWLRAYLAAAPQASDAKAVAAEVQRLEASVSGQAKAILATAAGSVGNVASPDAQARSWKKIVQAQVFAGDWDGAMASAKKARQQAGLGASSPAPEEASAAALIRLARSGRIAEAVAVMGQIDSAACCSDMAGVLARALIESGDAAAAAEQLALQEKASRRCPEPRAQILRRIGVARDYARNGQEVEAKGVLAAARRDTDPRQAGSDLMELLKLWERLDLSRPPAAAGLRDPVGELAGLAAAISGSAGAADLQGELNKVMSAGSCEDLIDGLTRVALDVCNDLCRLQALGARGPGRAGTTGGRLPRPAPEQRSALGIKTTIDLKLSFKAPEINAMQKLWDVRGDEIVWQESAEGRAVGAALEMAKRVRQPCRLEGDPTGLVFADADGRVVYRHRAPVPDLGRLSEGELDAVADGVVESLMREGGEFVALFEAAKLAMAVAEGGGEPGAGKK